MSLASVGSNLAGSILGNAKKATIILHQAGAGAGLELANVTGLAKTALTNAASIGGQAFSTAANALTGGGAALEVQYNPSTLRIQANAESTELPYLQQNIDNGIPNQETRPPAITLSVQLVFDDMNVKDAFMADKFQATTAGGLVSAGAALANTIMGHTYSVQPETNGLVAMLMRDETRLVTFQWADMSFTGEVTQAQARYTMFSLSGQPVRSTVDLVIMQQIVGSGATPWDTAFDQCFADTLAAAGGKSALQKAANLINISGF